MSGGFPTLEVSLFVPEVVEVRGIANQSSKRENQLPQIENTTTRNNPAESGALSAGLTRRGMEGRYVSACAKVPTIPAGMMVPKLSDASTVS